MKFYDSLGGLSADISRKNPQLFEDFAFVSQKSNIGLLSLWVQVCTVCTYSSAGLFALGVTRQ